MCRWSSRGTPIESVDARSPGRDRRNFNHLIQQWIWINTLQQDAAAAAGIRVVIHYLIEPLYRQQFRPTARMALQAAPFAATSLAPLWRLKPKPVRMWFGGVAGPKANPRSQLCQFGGGLYLRYNRNSNCVQAFSRADDRRELQLPMNGTLLGLRVAGRQIRVLHREIQQELN